MEWLTKAKDATGLHRATLGKANERGFSGYSFEVGRVDPELLVRRYAMWVHRCIGINASTAAGIPFQLMTSSAGESLKRYAKDMLGVIKTSPVSHEMKSYLRGESKLKPSRALKGRVGGNPDDLTAIDGHPALDLLNNVNEWTDGYAWRESIYADLQIFGRAFELLVNPSAGRVESIWRMMPQKTKVERSAAEFVSAFLYGTGPDEQRFSPDEVLWFKLYDPFDPWGGVGPLEAWLKTIDASLAIAAFQDDLFKRFGVPDYIIKTKAALDEPQKRAFRKDWRRMFGRLWRRQENIAFMGGDGEIERLGQTNKELEFSESSAQIRDYIGQAFGVPKALLTTDDVNRANLDGSRELHIETTIWPLIQRVEDALNEQIVSKFGPGLFIVHESPIKEDQTIRVAERASKLASGWSINEIRTEEGAEALSDPLADKPLVSSTVKTIDRLEAPDPSEMMLPPGAGPPAEDEDEPDEDEPQERGVTFSADQVKALLEMKVQAIRPVVVTSPAPPQLEAAVEVVKQSDLMGFKSMAFGEVADDAFDGYINAKFADDVDSTLKRQIKRVIKELVDAGLLETSEIRVDDYLRVEGWAEELAEVAKRHIGLTLSGAGQDAIDKLTAKVETTFSLENVRAQKYLDNASRRIGKDATDTWRDQIRGELLKGVDSGENTKEIAKRIEEMTPLSKGKAEMVSRTETAFASVNATEMGWEQSGVVVGKQFVLAPDACPWCQAVADEVGGTGRAKGPDDMPPGNVFPLGQPILEFGTTLWGEFTNKDGTTSRRPLHLNYSPTGGESPALSVPPVHPHCRCSMRPILDDEV